MNNNDTQSVDTGQHETYHFMLIVENEQDTRDSARAAVLTAKAAGRVHCAAEWPDWSEEWITGYARQAGADALKEWAENRYTRAGWDWLNVTPWPAENADALAEIGSLWRVDWTECAERLSTDDDA